MQQAAILEEDTKEKAKLYASYQSKMSPFNWSKKAFVKATHALKDRLSNHSATTPPDSRVDSQSHLPLCQPSAMLSVDETNDKDNNMRLIRRIAERRNLSKPKIQTMVGDGSVPPKPLPVYESMKSRSLRSGSEEDPFSDGLEAQASAYSHISGDLEIDFNKRTHGMARAMKNHNHFDGQIESKKDEPQEHVSGVKSTPAQPFSNKTSGLAQHPNVMDFSSSPLGFSTPRVRLEPQASTSGLKPNLGALTRSSSIIEFSFEAKSDDEKSAKSITDGSQSIKRKSAQSDLRSPTFPAGKRSKLASWSSNEEENLEMGPHKLDKEEEKLPLSPKDHNAVMKLPAHHSDNGGRVTIYQLGNESNDGKKARPRPIIGKRTSLPRPSSMFPSGRESRPGMKRLTSIDAGMDTWRPGVKRPTSVDVDMMDIDELQTVDARYQVGGKQR